MIDPTEQHRLQADAWLMAHLSPALVTPGMRRDLADLLATQSRRDAERFTRAIKQIAMGLPRELMITTDHEGNYAVADRG